MLAGIPAFPIVNNTYNASKTGSFIFKQCRQVAFETARAMAENQFHGNASSWLWRWRWRWQWRALPEYFNYVAPADADAE